MSTALLELTLTIGEETAYIRKRAPARVLFDRLEPHTAVCGSFFPLI